MSIVAWIEQLPREFWFTALFGSFATILYAVNEFAQPTFQEHPDRPETAFAPAELTSGTEYIISFCLYLAGLLGVYWTICLIGPAPFAHAGLTGGAETADLEVPGAFPLWVAMVLIGVLPRVPVLSFFEQSWRKLMHSRARIPQAVQVRARELRQAQYSFERFEPMVRGGQGLFARHVTPDDLTAPVTSPAHRWARLSAILQQLTVIDAYPEAAAYVDAEFMERHRTYLSAIKADYLQLADKIGRQRAALAATPARLEVVGGGAVGGSATAVAGPPAFTAIGDEHAGAIEDLLRRSCMFLGCAMLAAPQAVRTPDAAMRAFGFHSVPVSDVTSEVDIVIKSVVLGLLAYCLFVFVAFRVGETLPAWMGETGWPLLGHGNDRLQFIFNFLLPQLAAIFGALILRHSFRRKRAWFRNSLSRPSFPSVQKYVALFAVSFVLALITASYFAGTWQGAEKILSDLYWRFLEGFVPATSALFVCLAVDSVIVDWSEARRTYLAGLHAAVAICIGYLGAEHFYTNDRGLSFAGAIAYSTFGTFVYATALAVAVLLLAQRGALVRDGEDPLRA